MCLAAFQEVAVSGNAMQRLVRGADAPLLRSLRAVILAVKLRCVTLGLVPLMSGY